MSISIRLIPTKLRIEQIYLDPNNLRLFGVTREEEVPFDRITEKGIQEAVLDEMIREADLKPLRDSILQVGYLPIDRIVVKRINEDKFIVIEGNRRVATIKWILRDYERGELDLSKDRIRELRELEVLVFEGTDEDIKNVQYLIQGIRHTSGVKDWGPWQKALMVTTLYEMGMSPRDIKEALGGGVTVHRINRWIRAFKAWKQMKDDEEYGEYATTDKYSYFEEIIRKPYLRDEWLEWSDKDGKFLNKENLNLLYSWIIPSEELGGQPKIPMAIKLRELPDILQNAEIYNYFLNPNVDIDAAIARLRSIRSMHLVHIDWREELRRIESCLLYTSPSPRDRG